MFDKKKDQEKQQQQQQKQQDQQREADKRKSPEDKALEAKEARLDESTTAVRSPIEQSFGNDQQHRYDPKDVEKAEAKAKQPPSPGAGVPPAQGSPLSDNADIHIITPKEKNQALVKKDYSADIKVGSLVYKKPTEQNNNAPVSSTEGRPWTVMAINGSKANCLIMDPKDNMQRSEVLELKELMLDEPK